MDKQSVIASECSIPTARSGSSVRGDSISSYSIDGIIESFESDIASQGAASINLSDYADKFLDIEPASRTDGLVELLRVWIEHASAAGRVVTPRSLIEAFPEISFSEEQRAILEFEYQRQFVSQQSGRRNTSHDPQALPTEGSRWGNYELVALLGTGAYARVYLARQTDFANRWVALKLTYRDTAEASWLAKLQHTAIVPVYSTERHEGIIGICMPYLGNTTLADFSSQRISRSAFPNVPTTGYTEFAKNGQALLSTLAERQSLLQTHPIVEPTNPPQSHSTVSFTAADSLPSTIPVTSSLDRSPAARQLAILNPIDTILWLGAQTADGLAHAHRLGILHCDLKPANILLGSDGQPRLLDFNVSYDQTKEDPQVGLGGTPAYMAPEHWAALKGNGTIDARADIYSLGAVLYELFTGAPPQRPELQAEINLAPPPSHYRSGVTPAMDAIVMRCLHPNPDQRYRHADDLYDDLLAQLQHRPLVHQSEPSLRERWSKWKTRHPRLSSWSVALSIASLVIGFTTSGWYLNRERFLDSQAIERGESIANASLPAFVSLGTLQPMTVVATSEQLQEVLNHLPLSYPPQESDWQWTKRLPPTDQRELRQRLIQLQQMIDSSRLLSASHPSLAATTRTQLQSQLQAIELYIESHRSPAAIPKENESLDDETRSHAAAQEIDSRVLDFGSIHQAIHTGQSQQAIQQLRPWLAKQSHDYFAWLLLGMAHQAIGESDEAERCFTICTALDPKIPEGWMMRGEVRYQAKRYPLADADFSRAHNLRPLYLAPLLNRSLARKELKQFKLAWEDLSQVLDAGYRTVRTLRLKGTLQRAMGNLEAATAAEREALEMEPESELDWLEHGMLLVAKAPTKAADDFRRAIELNPNTVLGYQNLAAILADPLGQIEDSIATLTILIDRFPDRPDYRVGRAVLLGRQGKLEQMQNDLRAIEKQSVLDSLVMYQIASAYSLLGENQSKQRPELNEETLDKTAQRAARWTLKSFIEDPRWRSVAEKDPDSQWFRNRPEYQESLQLIYGPHQKPQNNLSP